MQKLKNIAKQSIYWLKVISLGLMLGLGIQFAQAWVNPTAAPPGGNVSGPITVGPATQTKAGSLGVMNDFLVGRLISFYTPNSTTACDGTTNGSMRFTGSDFEGCVGGVWKSLTLTGGSAPTPAPTPTLDLAYNLHSSSQCEALGGTVQMDGSDKYCKFSGYCKPGWILFKNWSQTEAHTCGSPGQCSNTCNTGGHTYQNKPQETCLYSDNVMIGMDEGGYCPDTFAAPCLAVFSSTGCY